jgi:hypothetical protein
MGTDGCRVCEWDGEVAETHDRSHRYYTHVIVKNGEVLKGRTCSERTRPRAPTLLQRLKAVFRTKTEGEDG